MRLIAAAVLATVVLFVHAPGWAAEGKPAVAAPQGVSRYQVLVQGMT